MGLWLFMRTASNEQTHRTKWNINVNWIQNTATVLRIYIYIYLDKGISSFLLFFFLCSFAKKNKVVEEKCQLWNWNRNWEWSSHWFGLTTNDTRYQCETSFFSRGLIYEMLVVCRIGRGRTHTNLHQPEQTTNILYHIILYVKTSQH